MWRHFVKKHETEGKSHAAIAFVREKMQSDLKNQLKFYKPPLNFQIWIQEKIITSYEEKLQIIRIIRSFRPDIITQDTEHCIYDLDPADIPL